MFLSVRARSTASYRIVVPCLWNTRVVCLASRFKTTIISLDALQFYLNLFYHPPSLKNRSPSSNNAGVIVYELNGLARICKGIVHKSKYGSRRKKYIIIAVVALTIERLFSYFPGFWSRAQTITNYRQWEGSSCACLMSMAKISYRL